MAKLTEEQRKEIKLIQMQLSKINTNIEKLLDDDNVYNVDDYNRDCENIISHNPISLNPSTEYVHVKIGDKKNMDIDKLPLSKQEKECLINARIYDVNDISKLTTDEIIYIKNLDTYSALTIIGIMIFDFDIMIKEGPLCKYEEINRQHKRLSIKIPSYNEYVHFHQSN